MSMWGGIFGETKEEHQARMDKAKAAGMDPQQHDVVLALQPGMVYNPELNQWVGPLTENMLDDTGKLITFGPASPVGLPSTIEAVVLLVALKRLSATPEGLRIIKDIAVKYLDTIGRIIEEMSQSSSAHVISCAMNQYVACTIYQRLGLMSPHDATQTRAWLDHQIGEEIYTERLGFGLSTVTTIVRSTNNSTAISPSGYEQESATGLAAFAKMLGK